MPIARAVSAKFKAFLFPVIESYSVVPVFRSSVIPFFRYSAFSSIPVAAYELMFVALQTSVCASSLKLCGIVRGLMDDNNKLCLGISLIK